MINFKISEHFASHELFSRVVLQLFGKDATWFLDPRLPIAIEALRQRYGVMYINNWYWGGKAEMRGFRSPIEIVGGQFSQHNYGRGCDGTFKYVTTNEVRDDIKKNWLTDYKPLGISAVEEDVSHLHFDLRWIPDQKELYTFKP